MYWFIEREETLYINLRGVELNSCPLHYRHGKLEAMPQCFYTTKHVVQYI
jgi:hypothetical protein